MEEQVEILRAIWNEVKALNGRVNTTNSRLEETNTRLDEMRVDLRGEIVGLRTELRTEMGELRRELRADIDAVDRRSVDRDMRLGSALNELSRDVRELTSIVHDWRDEHRLDREDLRERVARLERHAGLER